MVFLIQYSTQNFSHSNKVRERNKKDTNRKERKEIISFIDTMMLFLKDLEVFVTCLLNQI
jgi:hypothetical protein